MKIYIPFHIGSGNRGCEGITRGTANILGVEKEDLLLLNRDEQDYELDQKFALSQVGTLSVQQKRSFFVKVLKKIGLNSSLYYLNPFKNFFHDITPGDLCMFTGGDLFCYDATIKENCALHEYLKKKQIRTVLWGASVEECFLSPYVIEQLKSFEKIVCRETETLAVLNRNGIDNVACHPDPAFTLEPVACKLPDIFNHSKVIGINISNMVNGDGFDLNTMFAKNLKKLLDYIFTNTEYSVLLIPHVTWQRQDDNRMCAAVKQMYAEEKRLSCLDVRDLSYLQIRHIISNCELFVGGRTHSVVSAYSTCVPTLALGYSIKARGIAKDLGISDKLLFDSKNIISETELLEKFNYLLNNRDSIKAHLESVLPEYRKRAYGAKNVIKDLL